MKTYIIFSLLIAIILSAGGQRQKQFDPENDEMDQIALNTLKNYIEQRDSQLNLVKVLNCKVQVVAGIRYTLNILLENNNEFEEYLVDFILTPTQESDLIKFEKAQDSELNLQQVSAGSYHKFDWNTNDPETEEIKDKALEAIRKQLEQKKIEGDFEIIEAQFQSVNGMNIKLFFQMDNDTQDLYKAVIYMQPWTNTLQVSTFEKLQSLSEISSAESNLYSEIEEEMGYELEEDDIILESQFFEDSQNIIDYYQLPQQVQQGINGAIKEKLASGKHVNVRVLAAKQILDKFQLLVSVGGSVYDVSIQAKQQNDWQVEYVVTSAERTQF